MIQLAFMNGILGGLPMARKPTLSDRDDTGELFIAAKNGPSSRAIDLEPEPNP